jgi:hypothetical protein
MRGPKEVRLDTYPGKIFSYGSYINTSLTSGYGCINPRVVLLDQRKHSSQIHFGINSGIFGQWFLLAFVASEW